MEQQEMSLPEKPRTIVRKLARFAPNPALHPAKPVEKKRQRQSAAVAKPLQKSPKKVTSGLSGGNLTKMLPEAASLLPKAVMKGDGPPPAPRARKLSVCPANATRPTNFAVSTSSTSMVNQAAPEVRPPPKNEIKSKVELKTEITTHDGKVLSWLSLKEVKEETKKEEEEENSDGMDEDEEDSDYLRLTDHHRSLIEKGSIEVVGKGFCSVPEKSGRQQWGYFVLVFDVDIAKSMHMYFLPKDRIPEVHLKQFHQMVRDINETPPRLPFGFLEPLVD